MISCSRRRPVRRFTLLALMVLATAAPATADDAAVEAEGSDGASQVASPTAGEGLYAASFGRTDRGVIMIHYWSKGPRFRSETIVAGHPIITIVNGDFYYMMDELTQIGVSIRRTPQAIAADATRRRPFANELDEVIANGGEKIRSETVSGSEVDIYRLTNDQGRRTVWVSQREDRLPLHIETYNRDTAQTARLDYLNWMFGLPLADGFFEPPPGVELERFDSYEDYVARMAKGPVPPGPPLFQELLHSQRR